MRVGNERLASGDLEGAELAYRRAVRRRSRVWAPATYFLAVAVLRQGRHWEAVQRLVELLEEDDTLRGEACAQIADALSQMGDAFTLVQDPATVPQDEAWSVDVYVAVASLLEDADREGLDRVIVGRWPRARTPSLRRRAAADTQRGRRAILASRFVEAIDAYRRASNRWSVYLRGDPEAEDASESRYWLADAHFNALFAEILLERRPASARIAAAKRFAREARDAEGDDRFRQPAAMLVVWFAQELVKLENRRFAKGAGGFPNRTELAMEGEGDDRRVVTAPMPGAVVELIAAYDDYVAHVPRALEPDEPNHDRFAYLAGEIPFLYGHFEEARRRLRPLYLRHCGKSKYGYLAWEKLITMANLSGDFERSRALAELAKKRTCTFSDLPAPKRAFDSPKSFYAEAAAAYKTKKWQKAAELYDAALKQAPGRKEAPEAAVLGAQAYKHVGNYPAAIAMYELFVREYGSADRLARLQHGDAKRQLAPRPREYEERVKFLHVAYDALAEAQLMSFAYRDAAQTYERMAGLSRFSAEERRTAAYNAMFLFDKVGDRVRSRESKRQLFALNPSAVERAEAAWVLADDESLRDMRRFHTRFRNVPGAEAFVVRAAYHAAKADPKSADRWCRMTVRAFRRHMTTVPDAKGTELADMAAECAYRAIDEDLKARFDYASGFHRYRGQAAVMRDALADDLIAAKTCADRLQQVIDRYGSRRWAVAARARQGSLYESIRTGARGATWAKAEDLSEADRAMTRAYDEARLWARKWKVGPLVVGRHLAAGLHPAIVAQLHAATPLPAMP